MKTLKFTLRSLEDTQELARFVQRELLDAPFALCLLFGTLGSGKTTFSGMLGKEFGVKEPMQSPTYALERTYPLSHGVVLHHVDLYRLASIEEIYSYGFLDAMEEGGIWLVEWPELLQEEVQHMVPRIELHFTIQEEYREVEVRMHM